MFTKIHFIDGQMMRGPTLRSNGKCSNENAIMDNDLKEYDIIRKWSNSK